MARQVISGTPGETWTNDTGKFRYQLIVNWVNSCGVCISYDHMVGPSWPIPYHFNCRCVQLLVPPGGESKPFVDFRKKVDTLDPSQRGKVVGASNLKLIEAGKADWSDVVTSGRVRDLREVVSLKKLDVKTLLKAGIDRRTAEEAYASVHTAAHELAQQSRDRLLKALRDKGLSDAQIQRAVAERLAQRVTIGKGPSGPQASPVKVGPVPTPLTPEALGKALGVKLKPVPTPPAGTPILPGKPIAERIRAYTEGDAKVKAVIDAGAKLEADLTSAESQRQWHAREYLRLEREAISARGNVHLSRKLRDRLVADAEDGMRVANRGIIDAQNLAKALKEKLRDDVAEAIKAADPVQILTPNGGRSADTGKPLDALGPSARAAVDKAAAWLEKVVQKGDSVYHPVTVGQIPADEEQRAYATGNNVALKAGESAGTVVHEIGHTLETQMKTGGASALKVVQEFLAHRVGDEAPQSLATLFPAGKYGANEVGRKDKFGEVFEGSAAYYVGKVYKDATEVVSMGLEMLYNKPVDFAKKDPEFVKFLFGILDSSLR